MPKRSGFTILFAPEVVQHLLVIERKYHALIQATIQQQLASSPDRATRNRKLLEQPAPFGATWELRFGPANSFRVFYEIDHQQKTVKILAIGVKLRNRLLIGREEFGR
jgi:mRNA-degrading endonuclease RelE of RelBE toxin-antitoxin system